MKQVFFNILSLLILIGCDFNQKPMPTVDTVAEETNAFESCLPEIKSIRDSLIKGRRIAGGISVNGSLSAPVKLWMKKIGTIDLGFEPWIDYRDSLINVLTTYKSFTPEFFEKYESFRTCYCMRILEIPVDAEKGSREYFELSEEFFKDCREKGLFSSSVTIIGPTNHNNNDIKVMTAGRLFSSDSIPLVNEPIYFSGKDSIMTGKNGQFIFERSIPYDSKTAEKIMIIFGPNPSDKAYIKIGQRDKHLYRTQ